MHSRSPLDLIPPKGPNSEPQGAAPALRRIVNCTLGQGSPHRKSFVDGVIGPVGTHRAEGRPRSRGQCFALFPISRWESGATPTFPTHSRQLSRPLFPGAPKRRRARRRAEHQLILIMRTSGPTTYQGELAAGAQLVPGRCPGVATTYWPVPGIPRSMMAMVN